MSYTTVKGNGLKAKVGEKIRRFYYDSSVISNPKKFYNNLKFIIMYGDAADVAWALQVMYKGIVGLIGDRNFNNRVVERIKKDDDIDEIVKKIKDVLIENGNFYYVYIFLAILRRIMEGEFLENHFKKHNKDCENLYKQCPILKALRCVYDNWEKEEGWSKINEMFEIIINKVYSFCSSQENNIEGTSKESAPKEEEKKKEVLEQTSCEN